MTDTATTTEKKIEELYELIDTMEIALLTTRRSNGQLVTRPMATQKPDPIADLWFVTDIDSEKIDELQFDPNVNLGFYDPDSREWVSVSGLMTISQDRSKIRELYQPDWKMWFGDEGGARDGGPDDPRLALLLVEARSVHYMKSRYTKPMVLFELLRAKVKGEAPELGREETLTDDEL